MTERAERADVGVVMTQGEPATDRRALLARHTRLGLRVLLGLLLVSVPFAVSLVAIGYAPPAHVEIAGQRVSVRPVIGQDTSRLFSGALVRPQHKRILGRDVGVDVDADWNRLVPSDKRTRSYLLSLWENPRPAIHRIETTAARHLVTWGVGGFVLGLLAVTGVVALWWQRRRRLAGYTADEAELIGRHNHRLRVTLVTAGVVLALAVDALGARVWLHDSHGTPKANPMFRGTELEGTQVTGLLSDVLPFLSVLRPRSSFYDRAAQHLEDQLAVRPGLVGNEHEVTFVLAEDFEDVNGMARQVGLSARLFNADFIALTGDLTFAGKAIETYVLDTVDYYSEGRPVYLAPGLHDTPTIVSAAESRDWHVGEGNTRDVEGLSLLSFPDPRISTVGNFGAGDVERRDGVDTETFIRDAIQRTCEDKPDFVLLHDHLLGQRIAATGCARVAVLDGRSYQFIGPRPGIPGRTSTEFTVGSAGGHVDTKPNPGIIEHPARFAVFHVDKDTLETSYSVVTVEPDASVSVTPRVGLTTPYNPAG